MTRLPDKSVLCPYLSPKPSPALRSFLVGVHALALVAAGLSPVPLALRIALALAVVWSLWQSWRTYLNPAIVGLRLLPDGSWRLSWQGGGEIDARLLGSSISSPWFVLLHLRTGQARRHNLLICRDSLEPESYRRLRVALRVAGLKGQA